MGKLYGLHNRPPGLVTIALPPLDFKLLMFTKQ
jgi:hypothetical protein